MKNKHWKTVDNQYLLTLLRDEKRGREEGRSFFGREDLKELKGEIERRKKLGLMRKDAGVEKKKTNDSFGFDFGETKLMKQISSNKHGKCNRTKIEREY